MPLLRIEPDKPGYKKFELIDESGARVPKAILFHTWRDGEVSYEYVCGPTALQA
jgi:hypothetical protein